MAFKSKEVIIGAPLVLNELPKYCDKIKAQSALDPHWYKNVSFLATVLWCMGLQIIQSALNHKRKKYFRFWLHYYYGTWNLENIQSDYIYIYFQKRKYIFLFLATVLLWWVELIKVSVPISFSCTIIYFFFQRESSLNEFFSKFQAP